MTYHLKKSAAGVMVLLVNLKMFIQFVDTGGKHGYLHFGRTGIALMSGVGLDYFLLLFLGHCFHLIHYICRNPSRGAGEKRIMRHTPRA